MHRSFALSSCRLIRPIVTLSRLSPAYLPLRLHNSRSMATNGANGVSDSRPVFFFDIDNCVSQESLKLTFRSLTILCSYSSILKVSALDFRSFCATTDRAYLCVACNIHDEMQTLISKRSRHNMPKNTKLTQLHFC